MYITRTNPQNDKDTMSVNERYYSKHVVDRSTKCLILRDESPRYPIARTQQVIRIPRLRCAVLPNQKSAIHLCCEESFLYPPIYRAIVRFLSPPATTKYDDESGLLFHFTTSGGANTRTWRRPRITLYSFHFHEQYYYYFIGNLSKGGVNKVRKYPECKPELSQVQDSSR